VTLRAVAPNAVEEDSRAMLDLSIGVGADVGLGLHAVP